MLSLIDNSLNCYKAALNLSCSLHKGLHVSVTDISNRFIGSLFISDAFVFSSSSNIC